MTHPLGADDFFATEAGEYLGRLTAIITPGADPNGDELVRYTRALRGSALMAGQQAIAKVTAGLEQLARAYREGRRPWDVALSTLVNDTLTTLQVLIDRVRTWGPEDAARAERLAGQLEAFAGPAPRPGPAAAAAQASDAGVRAFLAREAAALGSVLDQTARAIGGTPSNEALPAILRRMQPLRGMAALNDFPPLPDLLDGIERTVGSLSRLEVPPKVGRERLGAAASALGRAARDIAERGRPDPEAEEFHHFAAALLVGEGATMPTVPIESLFFAGEDGLIQRGTLTRAAEAPLSGAALVARGEHLCQAADEIAQAASAAQRGMRFHLLLEDLRTLGGGLPQVLESALDGFVATVRNTITAGDAGRAPAAFAAIIREAGTLFRGLGEGSEAGSLRRPFEALTTQLQQFSSPAPHPAPAAPAAAPARPAPTPAPRPAPAPAPGPVRPSSTVVPIESLAPDVTRVPSASTNGEWDLAATFAQYEALVSGTAAPRPTSPVSSAAAPRPEPALVDIDQLLYHGRGALERADEIRREILAARSSGGTGGIEPLLDELLDLIEMAVAD